MSEESLHKLPLGDLIDLMVKSADELYVMNRLSHDRDGVVLKLKEVELIQKIIGIKRRGFSPE